MQDMLVRKKLLKIQERLGMRVGIVGGTKRNPDPRTTAEVLDVLKDLYAVGVKAYVLPTGYFSRIIGSTDLYKEYYGELLRIKEQASKYNIELLLRYPDLGEQPDETIKRFATISSIMDARAFVFRPDFYRNVPSSQALKLVVYKLNELAGNLNVKVNLGLETTGRMYELGTVEDLTDIIKRTQSTEIVLNWGALHARGAGTFRTSADFRNLLQKLREGIGSQWMQNALYIVSAYMYGASGAVRQIPLEKSDLNISDLIMETMAFGIKGTFLIDDPEKEQWILRSLDKLADMVR